jgi:hypothetical protein
MKEKLEQLYNKHFKGENIKDCVSKIPWKKCSGIIMHFCWANWDKVDSFAKDLEILADENGYHHQWDGVMDVYIYEKNNTLELSLLI